MRPRALPAFVLAVVASCGGPHAGASPPSPSSSPASRPAPGELERARALLAEDRPREALALLGPLLAREVPAALRPALHALAALAHARVGEREAARRRLETFLRQSGLSAGERAWAQALTGELAGKGEARTSVGLLIPRSGPLRSVGHELRAGVLAGSGVLEPGSALRVVVGDSAADPVVAARRLLDGGARALIGGLDAEESARIAELAATRGVPFLAILCPRAPGTSTLCVVPSGEQRARALLARGLEGLPAGRLAWIAPDSSYGRSLTAVLETAARERGVSVVARVRYPGATTSFAAQAKALAAAEPDLVFVPDTAQALALIAPALAGAGLWPTAGRPGPRTRTRGRRERSLRLIATADGLTASLLASAGRYLDGTLLAPGFCPEDPPAGREERARRFLGRAPTALEAFAHDAALLLAEGARRRSLSPAALRALHGVIGLTGTPRFGADGRRVDPPRVCRIDGGRLRAAE